ncbi:hypothetical protein CK815_04690 [Brucella abortus]|nr:hypothetical protein CK813_05480 [Brucella abortus]ATA39786.1 hypothetical protein CK815_04690 [Brucella abortus]
MILSDRIRRLKTRSNNFAYRNGQSAESDIASADNGADPLDVGAFAARHDDIIPLHYILVRRLTCLPHHGSWRQRQCGRFPPDPAAS